MSQGPIEIVNVALAFLGKEPIHKFGSTTEDEPAARIGERLYNISRDIAVAGYDWYFARYTAKLNEVPDPHPFGVRYRLPSDCVTPRILLPRAGKPNKWILEGRDIIIPTLNTQVGGATPYLQYTTALTDTGLFPPYFIYPLSLLIASMMCMPVTKDLKYAAELEKKARYELGKAQVIDSTVGRNDDTGDQDPWNDSFNDPDVAGVRFNDG